MHFSHMEFVSGIWNLRLPAKVAKTISFTVFLEPWIKKALVFIAFEHLLLGGHAKTISFMVFFAWPPDQGC